MALQSYMVKGSTWEEPAEFRYWYECNECGSEEWFDKEIDAVIIDYVPDVIFCCDQCKNVWWKENGWEYLLNKTEYVALDCFKKPLKKRCA